MQFNYSYRSLGTQSGNVLFLILIAVALFAALSYAVTSSNRGSTQKGTEAGAANASRIMSYIAQLRSTTMRLKLSGNGASIMYNNDIYSSNNETKLLPMGTPANPSMYVFHAQGGNLPAQTFEDISTISTCQYGGCSAGSYPKPGHLRFYYAQIDNIGTSEADIVAFIFMPDRETCTAFNKLAGVSGTTSASIGVTDYQTSSAINTPPSSPTAMVGPGLANLSGKMEFCYYSTNADGTGNSYSSLRIVAVLEPR